MIKVLKFQAKWCAPCKVLTNVMKSADLDGVAVEEVDIDNNQTLVEQYNIRSVPTLVFIKDEKEVNRLTGMQTLDKIKETVSGIY